jgi:hypothetical protein
MGEASQPIARQGQGLTPTGNHMKKHQPIEELDEIFGSRA